MKTVKETLEERGEVYGDYEGGSEFRAAMMELVEARYENVNDTVMPAVEKIYIFDIVNKLSRLAVTPKHADTWLDIAGYAELAKEAVNE